MKRIRFSSSAILVAGAIGLVMYGTACEVNIGNPASPSSGGGDSTPRTPTGGGGTPTPDDGGTPGGGLKAPGVPVPISPGNGDAFSGAGQKVRFMWTDAEGAAQFEVVVQGLSGGGWQPVAQQVTDNYEFTLTMDSQPYTQYRWRVRSIGTDSQTSAFTGWRSFSWTL